jgi:hypothetical protein
VGSKTAVSGSGFEPNQDITLYFDGSATDTECRSKGDGTFRYCALSIPASGVGTHTVTASDAQNAASTGYTVNPGISLTPSRGPVGSGAAVGGSGFTPNSRIKVTVGHHDVSTDCRANAVGSFSNCVFTVPDMDPGAHVVTARDFGGTAPILRFYHSAAATYSVTPGASLDPAGGSVTDKIRVSGSGFKPNRILRVSFDGSRRPTSGDCTTNAKGNLPASNGCTFTIPAETAGTFNVTVTDGTYSYTTTYSVTPDVSLSFNEGAVDSNVSVSGTGFSSFRPVTLQFGDTTAALTDDSGKTCTTDATGTFDCEFDVPAASAGSQKVTVSDDNGFSDATHFKVTPSVEIITEGGSVGSTVTVVGDGFKAKETVTVTFDDQKVSTDCKTDRNGSLSPCAFTVPATTAGDHKVMVSAGDHSAWALYSVGPDISLNATAGSVGSTVMLTGSNYPPNSTLSVTWEDAKLKTTGTCTTDAKGNLPATNNCAFTVPATTAGPYDVTVSAGGLSGSATYTVSTAIGLSPSDGPVGSGAAVSGSGFAPNSPIKVTVGGSSVTLTGLGGAVPCTTDGDGNFSYCSFTVPDVHTGARTVTAKDGSGYAASATYTVGGSINLSLPGGTVGSTITLSGSNWKSGSTLTVSLDGEKLNTSGSCTADASGKLNNCTFTIPAATGGDHTLTVSDGTYTGTATLTVNPSLSLSASTGAAGSAAAVSGSGFAPFSTISGTFDGSGVTLMGSDGTACTADAQGSFSNCGFTVPVKPAGLRAVTVSDSAKNSATGTFTINPAFSLTASEGPAGSSASIIGSGFMAFAPITVSFDGNSVTTPNCQANASGRVSCSFAIPATTAGEHTVTATDGTYTGTATYSVDPTLSLIGSGTGAPGTSLTVRGSGFTSGTVTVTFDGSKVATCDASSNGNINACTLTVPATAPSGSNIVAASDKKGYSASAIYNI